MTSVETAYHQVLARLRESLDTPVAELPTGDGPADTPEITNEAQIVAWLDEGQKLLARTPLLEIRGTAQITGVTVGERQWDMTEATVTPADRVLWRIESAAWTTTSTSDVKPLEVNDGRFYPIHHPSPITETAARPRRIYDTGKQILIGPKPSAAGTINITGLLLPLTAEIGGDLDDVPDEKVHHVVAFACWRVCQRMIAEGAYAAALPIWQNEIAWAAPFLGLGAQ